MISSSSSPKFIIKKLKEHAVRLDFLLSKRLAIKTLNTIADEKIIIYPGITSHYKIQSEHQTTPLKVTVNINKSASTIYMYISQLIERPSHNNCDLEIELKRKSSLIIYYGDGKPAIFNKPYIYITLVSDKASSIVIGCHFGQHKTKKKPETVGEEMHQGHKLLTFHQINDLIKRMKNNEKELKDFNEEAKTILRKRRQKSLQLSNNINILQRNKEFLPSCYTSRYLKESIIYKRTERIQKEQKVILLRDSIEVKSTLKKFINTYKQNVTRICV